MKSGLFFVASLLTSLIAGSAPYEGQKVLQCQVRNKEAASLLQDMDIWSFDVRSLNVTVRVINDEEMSLAQTSGHCAVLTENLALVEEPVAQSLLTNTQLAPSEFFSDYRSYETIRDSLKDWVSKSDVATFIPSIGKTVEGRDIFAIKITNPGKGPKKGIWFNGGLHAREWIAPTATIYAISKFIEGAKTPQIKALLDVFEFHFTPLANPDGYEYTRTSGNRLWRKNRRVNGNGSYGVDLNRNWDEHWGKVGSSTNPNADTYQGTAANSEPEVKALAKYALEIPNRYGGIDIHSYGQYILHNWGWTTKLSQNEKLLKPLGLAIQQAFKSKGYDYTSQTSADLYPASGALDDWMAAKAKLVSFTMELCPNPNSFSGFQLPANQIVKCAEGAYAGIIAYSEHLKTHATIPPNPPIRR